MIFDEWVCSIDWPGLWETIRNIVLTLSSGGGFTLALLSYNKWIKEHKGKDKYDIAKDITLYIYTFKRQIDRMSKPWWITLLITYSDLEKVFESLKITDEHKENVIKQHEDQIIKIKETWVSLEKQLPFARVHWGQDTATNIEELEDYMHRITEYLECFNLALRSNRTGALVCKKSLISMSDRLALRTPESQDYHDKWLRKFNEAIRPFETYIE
ncbi:hypothetical protein [uncultured Gilvimarinus sp.]|uniref:hypothetical protein n=1 Tax=uncultured Gilvimarinus sp. TaxID=1689143 RepID=UPI0030EF947A|tara:strand:- start:3867 stop:4508 length:642 start_codon:yes stop_codon:yes gene_type:complete